MRLSTEEVALIRSCVFQHLGDDCLVVLFGSRVDDTRRGGDIDIHVTMTGPQHITVDQEIDLKMALEDALGDHKVDLVVRSKSQPARPFDIMVTSRGVRL